MRKQILIVSALFLSMTIFAQKDELKTAEKAVKANDFAAAMSALNQAESLIAGADEKSKAKFYYLKAMATYQNGANPKLADVGAAFNTVIDYENEIKTSKYSNELATILNKLIQTTAEKANANYNNAVASKSPDDYKMAAKQFYQVYMLSPRDTSFLDNAALVYFFAQDYDTSKEMYEKLLELNYTGVSTVYVATNKEDGKEIEYADKKERDLQVKLGLAINPSEKASDSRREYIFKNLAANYVSMKDLDMALEVLTQGRKEFPSSYNLLIDEANVHYQKGNNEMFTSKLEEAIKLNPTEPSLYYNVGVMNMEQKKIDEAIKNFEKAIELDPNYSDAYNNIGAAIIEKAAPIIDEMNKSLNDFAKYDKLQVKQFDIYKQALPYYEKAFELNKTNIGTVQTLMGLYENLDMQDKLETVKAVYESMKE